jgi:A/G-specific adenine glycosylase
MAGLRRRLLAWYDANRRDLPWRRTRDPYAIWISEAMLQQTRVETVIPYWERFLARFPDAAALAGADLDDVLGAWAGLGYYSRARNLHAAAREIVARHAGRLPDDPDALRALPGIGRYTAGAIASIAFDRPEPVVDGNVRRVLARFGREDGEAALWEAAARLASGTRPGDLNQALMELGATLCAARAPRCEACPLAGGCAARRAGDVEAFPRRAPRRAVPRVESAAAWLERDDLVLAVRRPARGLLGGLWELPGGELADGERPAAGLRERLRASVGLSVGRLEPVGCVEHALTHRFLRVHVYRGRAPRGRVRLNGPSAHRWLPPEQLVELPQAVLTRKALALLL